jgi:hypothetical protein
LESINSSVFPGQKKKIFLPGKIFRLGNIFLKIDFYQVGEKKRFSGCCSSIPDSKLSGCFFFYSPPPQDWANVLYGAGAITLYVISFKEGRRLVGKNKIK